LDWFDKRDEHDGRQLRVAAQGARGADPGGVAAGRRIPRHAPAHRAAARPGPWRIPVSYPARHGPAPGRGARLTRGRPGHVPARRSGRSPGGRGRGRAGRRGSGRRGSGAARGVRGGGVRGRRFRGGCRPAPVDHRGDAQPAAHPAVRRDRAGPARPGVGRPETAQRHRRPAGRVPAGPRGDRDRPAAAGRGPGHGGDAHAPGPGVAAPAGHGITPAE